MAVFVEACRQRNSLVSGTLSSGADGHISGSVDYDVFGKPVAETGVFVGSAGGSDATSGGISALVFAYAGKPYDSVTGLSDYGFRDYASGLARFTTVDPIRDGSNWYAYCNSDPINYVDAWGLTASDNNSSNNGMYGERYHNGQYVLTVDVNNPEAFEAAMSAYSGVRKYGAAGTTPVDSIALTDSSGQIIHTFSDEEAMLRYAGYESTGNSSNNSGWSLTVGVFASAGAGVGGQVSGGLVFGYSKTNGMSIGFTSTQSMGAAYTAAVSAGVFMSFDSSSPETGILKTATRGGSYTGGICLGGDVTMTIDTTQPDISASITGSQGGPKSLKLGIGESATKVEAHVYTNITETKVWSFGDVMRAFK